jgi:2-C-methyl-D-erythritol 4-phosphate cytidylyltransferase
LKRVALIPAAGMGRRMGASMNKQYLLLDGKPILAHTLELFQQADFIDEIVVVVPAEEIEYCRIHVVEKYGIEKVRQIVAGGAERQDSVLNGLRAIDCHDGDVVLIHDGVRPFVTLSTVQRSIEMALEHDGALVAVPVKDTVIIVKDAFVTSTPARKSLWLAQTPQSFRYKIIRAAHERAEAEGFTGTDDASLLERIGKKVHVVIGDYRNIKITTPEDLILAQAFLDAGKRGERQ